MQVRIYQQPKSAMQSGQSGEDAESRPWRLEPVRIHRSAPDALTGWGSSRDTLKTVRLTFARLDEAIAYAEAHGLDYVVSASPPRRRKPKNYVDNFAFSRKRPWTH